MINKQYTYKRTDHTCSPKLLSVALTNKLRHTHVRTLNSRIMNDRDFHAPIFSALLNAYRHHILYEGTLYLTKTKLRMWQWSFIYFTSVWYWLSAAAEVTNQHALIMVCWHTVVNLMAILTSPGHYIKSSLSEFSHPVCLGQVLSRLSDICWIYNMSLNR